MRGFTLLELLVVLVIAAGAVAIVGTRFDVWSRAVAVKAGTQRLASALRGAQGRAVLEGHPVEVHIDPARAGYWTGASPQVRLLGAGLRLEALSVGEPAPDGASDKPSGIVVRFFPSGDASAVALRVSDERNRAYRLEVSGLTGQVRVRPEGAVEDAR